MYSILNLEHNLNDSILRLHLFQFLNIDKNETPHVTYKNLKKGKVGFIHIGLQNTRIMYVINLYKTIYHSNNVQLLKLYNKTRIN